MGNFQPDFCLLAQKGDVKPYLWSDFEVLERICLGKFLELWNGTELNANLMAESGLQLLLALFALVAG